jgi:DNA-directed RNA polymerase subunit RPC12/RpoP
VVEPTSVARAGHPVAGRDYPADLAQLRKWFASDDACLEYLGWLRWPDGFVCPGCGRRWGYPPGARYRCGGCGRRVSVTAGTLFDKTRVPLTV